MYIYIYTYLSIYLSTYLSNSLSLYNIYIYIESARSAPGPGATGSSGTTRLRWTTS